MGKPSLKAIIVIKRRAPHAKENIPIGREKFFENSDSPKGYINHSKLMDVGKEVLKNLGYEERPIGIVKRELSNLPPSPEEISPPSSSTGEKTELL